jgi:hypothetical protein
MRALVLLAMLATAGCGLDMGGLGADPSDGETSPDASSADQAVPASQDGGGRPDIASPSVDGAGQVPREDASSADGGGDAVAAPPGDAGADAEASTFGVSDAGRAIDEGAEMSPSTIDGGGDAAASDGGNANAPDAPISPSDASVACMRGIPGGWKLSVYSVGSDPCPMGFADHEVLAEPTVAPAGCSCGCDVTQDGDCMEGSLIVYGNPDNGPSCDTPLFQLDVTGNACLVSAPNMPAGAVTMSAQVTALPPQGGACSSALQVDPTQVSTPSARYCDVPTASIDSVCGGSVPAGFAVCIASGGTTTCPPGTPFVHRSVVEDDVTLQCSPCSACAVGTACSNASVSVYDNRACREPPVESLQVDGMCDVSAASAMANVVAVKYSATEATTCTAGSSTAAVQLANPRTICCQ